jgi:hypothetical protein
MFVILLLALVFGAIHVAARVMDSLHSLPRSNEDWVWY